MRRRSVIRFLLMREELSLAKYSESMMTVQKSNRYSLRLIIKQS